MSAGQLFSVLRHVRKLAAAESGARLDDAELLDRFVRRRDEAAFELLVWRHGALVWSVCRRVLCQRIGLEDAEDAFQATFLILARKARSIGKRESLASWLYKVAYRVALRARGEAARRVDNRQDGVEHLAVTPPDEVLWADLRPVLDEEVNRLPARYRVPVILCYLEGKTNAEAAVELRCPRGTIATRLSRARTLLRERLTRRGITLTATGLAVAVSAERAGAALTPTLVASTVQTSLASAAGAGALAGIVSANVATLSQGVLHAMFLTKLKIAAAVTLTLGVLGMGTGVVTYQAFAAGPGEISIGALTGQQGEGKKKARDVGALEQARLRDQAEAERARALEQEARARLAEQMARADAQKLQAEINKLRDENAKLRKEAEAVRNFLEAQALSAADAEKKARAEAEKSKGVDERSSRVEQARATLQRATVIRDKAQADYLIALVQFKELDPSAKAAEPVAALAWKNLRKLTEVRLMIAKGALEASSALDPATRGVSDELIKVLRLDDVKDLASFNKHLAKVQAARLQFDALSQIVAQDQGAGPAVSQQEKLIHRTQRDKALMDWAIAVEDLLRDLAGEAGSKDVKPEPKK